MDAAKAMRWYAVNTKPHQEETVVSHLSSAGIETFYPRLRQPKRVRGRQTMVTGPLFPGYLFVRFSLETHYRTVQYARGVRRVVAFGLQPEPVDPQIIDGLKLRMEEGYVTLKETSLRPQEPVRIEEGPFQGLVAVFERPMDDGERVMLLLRTLSYQARVIVDLEHVVKC